ncbi:MAG: hypothetical protein GQ544_01405 [Candidatus Aminicenantes bacterium]|nr:hypothetical protein [Candidatus Aminicenantes bacterium]
MGNHKRPKKYPEGNGELKNHKSTAKKDVAFGFLPPRTFDCADRLERREEKRRITARKNTDKQSESYKKRQSGDGLKKI